MQKYGQIEKAWWVEFGPTNDGDYYLASEADAKIVALEKALTEIYFEAGYEHGPSYQPTLEKIAGQALGYL